MKKILVVDDELDILEIIKLMLGFNGFEVHTASTWDEAREILNCILPDLALLDINLGSHDGRHLCSELRTELKYMNMPVILVSANTQALRTYGQYGAFAGIEKPFDIDFLLGKVQSALLTASS